MMSMTVTKRVGVRGGTELALLDDCGWLSGRQELSSHTLGRRVARLGIRRG